jgi:hypothetical protein
MRRRFEEVVKIWTSMRLGRRKLPQSGTAIIFILKIYYVATLTLSYSPPPPSLARPFLGRGARGDGKCDIVKLLSGCGKALPTRAEHLLYCKK